MTRTEILGKANSCVNGEREQQYGTPEKNFDTIAELWSKFLGYGLTPEDVCCMMILLKIARIKTGNGKDDNWVDIAGYAACGGEITSDMR